MSSSSWGNPRPIPIPRAQINASTMQGKINTSANSNTASRTTASSSSSAAATAATTASNSTRPSPTSSVMDGSRLVHDLTEHLIKSRACTFDLDTVFSLNLSRCNIPKLGASLLHCVNLTHLDLSHNHIHPNSLSILQGQQLAKLQTLDLSHNLLSDISNLPSIPTLEHLYLHGNLLSSLASLSILPRQVPALQTLTLQRANGTDSNPLCSDVKYASTTRALRFRQLDMLDERPTRRLSRSPEPSPKSSPNSSPKSSRTSSSSSNVASASTAAESDSWNYADWQQMTLDQMRAYRERRKEERSVAAVSNADIASLGEWLPTAQLRWNVAKDRIEQQMQPMNQELKLAVLECYDIIEQASALVKDARRASHSSDQGGEDHGDDNGAGDDDDQDDGSGGGRRTRPTTSSQRTMGARTRSSAGLGLFASVSSASASPSRPITSSMHASASMASVTSMGK